MKQKDFEQMESARNVGFTNCFSQDIIYVYMKK